MSLRVNVFLNNRAITSVQDTNAEKKSGTCVNKNKFKRKKWKIFEHNDMNIDQYETIIKDKERREDSAKLEMTVNMYSYSLMETLPYCADSLSQYFKKKKR